MVDGTLSLRLISLELLRLKPVDLGSFVVVANHTTIIELGLLEKLFEHIGRLLRFLLNIVGETIAVGYVPQAVFILEALRRNHEIQIIERQVVRI